MPIAVLILIGLPFAGIGALAAFQCYQTLTSGHPEFFVLLMFWPFAVLFSAGGWFLILIGIFGKQTAPGAESPLAQRKRLLGIKTPDQQWAVGQIQSRGKAAVIGAWLKAAFGLVIVAPALWIGITRGWLGGEQNYLAWTASALVPLWLIGTSVYRALVWQKYGASMCELVERPNRAGGELRFVIRPERMLLPMGEATVRLRCEKRENRGYGKHRRLHITVLWQETKSIPVYPGMGMSASFSVPPGVPDAAPNRNEGIFWILEARSATPGLDYAAEFDLALKRTDT